MDIFKDLLVIELASVLAGPHTGSFFAELGAHVIKIENKLNGGDVTRSWKTAAENQESPVSAYYASANTKKEIIWLDLKNVKDKNTLHSLLIKADMVIGNFKPGDAEKLELTYEHCQKFNSKIIYGEITGFGENDNRVAYDLVLQAETGYMSINGQKDSIPTKLPVAFIDLFAAHHLKEGLLVALYKRNLTGQGSKISVSLYDAAVAALANQASNYLNTGVTPVQQGSLHPNIAPYGEIFHSSDKVPFVLAIGSQKQFNKLKQILKCNQLENPLFGTNSVRVKNREMLFNILKDEFAVKVFEEWRELFLSENIPFGKINTINDVFQDKTAQNLIVKECYDNTEYRHLKTAVFKINNELI